ncbi:hypothetical protein Xhom_04418 [Xenorhabdus hominickii]|uniref:Uncharacterized protein n=1 Tax=Xenorhabdus hominickii TaxID=351679 RepID=A0A1V0M438_XENHO|nr:hypothetical protein [Xenorhabdus hominickii]PHM52341.1 hypothetical protein Xhom_04418 [Xenorhabdus hominickii]
MNHFSIVLFLLYIGGAGLMFESLSRKGDKNPFLKCWAWVFICLPSIKSEIARIRR